VVAHVPLKNQFRESKKIPYAVLISEPDTPSWSSCEYSSTPSILSIEEEVSCPWEITIADFMNDFQARRMGKTKSTPRVRTPDELLVEGTLEGNLHSALKGRGSRSCLLAVGPLLLGHLLVLPWMGHTLTHLQMVVL